MKLVHKMANIELYFRWGHIHSLLICYCFRHFCYSSGFCLYHHPVMKVRSFCFVHDGNKKHGFHAKNNRAEKLLKTFRHHVSRRRHGTKEMPGFCWQVRESTALTWTAYLRPLAKCARYTMVVMRPLSGGRTTGIKWDATHKTIYYYYSCKERQNFNTL